MVVKVDTRSALFYIILSIVVGSLLVYTFKEDVCNIVDNLSISWIAMRDHQDLEESDDKDKSQS